MWSKVEKAKLYVDIDNPGWSTICHDYGWSHETIDIITIDSLELWKVDFIKMDIEGYEYEAFLWMEKLIENNPDIKILFEWSPQFYDNMGDDWKEYSINILHMLQEKWFTLYLVDQENIGEKHKIKDFNKVYNEVWTEFWTHADIFALRE